MLIIKIYQYLLSQCDRQYFIYQNIHFGSVGNLPEEVVKTDTVCMQTFAGFFLHVSSKWWLPWLNYFLPLAKPDHLAVIKPVLRALRQMYHCHLKLQQWNHCRVALGEKAVEQDDILANQCWSLKALFTLQTKMW